MMSRLRFSTSKADVLFTLIGMMSIMLLIKSTGDAEMAEAALTPVTMGISAIIATIVIALIVSFGADLDRRCAEDYAFQLTANAAVIAVLTTMFGYVIWDMGFLNEIGLPKPRASDVLGMMLLSWSIGYGLYRIRGIKS